MKAAVMISDGRMQVVADELMKLGVEVYCGTDKESIEQIEELSHELDALLLPIRGIDENGMIHIPGVDYKMDTILARLPKDADIATGLWTPFLKQSDRKIFCYYDDNKVRQANARLTAEGALFYFMEKTKRSIFDYEIDLIGYGHVGREIAELFGAIGLPVRIVAEEKEQTNRNFRIISYEDWKKKRMASVIINTAPVQVLTKEMKDVIPQNALIIDIASGHIGVAPQLYERKDLQIEAAPGLPGLVAEESAGLILVELLKRRWGLEEEE